MIKTTKFTKIKEILRVSANEIQLEATRQHKKFLGGKNLRTDAIAKYQNSHIKIVAELANYLDSTDLQRGLAFFNTLGEEVAQAAVRDGLTIEETVDGTIFLKQAVWKRLETEGMLKELTVSEYHELNFRIGTYCDTISSRIAFTYHKERLYIEENLKYLAEASKILSSSLDYQTTLNAIAHLAVPHIADWCGVDLVIGGKLEQVAVAHKDPKKVKWAKELRKVQPPDMEAQAGMPQVLRSGKPELYRVIDDAMLVRVAKSKKQLALLRKLGFTSAMVVPIFSQKTAIGGISFVSTEMKRHYNEADLIMAEELATRASVAIENAKLYKGSQEAITMRDDFISVASHELKTPVTSVKMFTQVLKKHSEQIGDTKAIENLARMDKQLNKLTELIYDLLNISKIRAGRLQFKEREFDFDTSVREVAHVLQQSESRHTIVVTGKTGKMVYGDEERIGQVIENLVSNALKYSPKADKVLVTLSSKNAHVKVAVKDFGIGMAPEHLTKIFEQFYRVYDTTDKTFPGLGIGLYIASEIIKRHGGKLWVESNVGKGSTFYFTIPIHRKKEAKKPRSPL